jgi:hypothetical protein
VGKEKGNEKKTTNGIATGNEKAAMREGHWELDEKPLSAFARLWLTQSISPKNPKGANVCRVRWREKGGERTDKMGTFCRGDYNLLCRQNQLKKIWGIPHFSFIVAESGVLTRPLTSFSFLKGRNARAFKAKYFQVCLQIESFIQFF